MASSATTISSAGGGGSARSNLAKAYLDLRTPSPGSAGNVRVGASRGRITFQFNPRELTMSKAARWAAEPARSAPHTGPAEFQGAEPCTLELEMFFDGTDGRTDVVASVDKLFNCCVPTAESRSQKKPVPPVVVFHWGKITGFPAVIASVSATYTLFTSTGTPVRALCSVRLDEIATEPTGQNPTSGALAAKRAHTIVAGETLPSIAYADYGDPALWRVIAEANGIDDPMRVPPGTSLTVPNLDEL
ncbi:MAG: LysM peptidoglycan-binding domain-containing protein [Sciscionella sp.]